MKPENWPRVKELMTLRDCVSEGMAKLNSISECDSLTLSSSKFGKTVVLTNEQLGKTFIESLQSIMVNDQQRWLNKIDSELRDL